MNYYCVCVATEHCAATDACGLLLWACHLWSKKRGATQIVWTALAPDSVICSLAGGWKPNRKQVTRPQRSSVAQQRVVHQIGAMLYPPPPAHQTQPSPTSSQPIHCPQCLEVLVEGVLVELEEVQVEVEWPDFWPLYV